MNFIAEIDIMPLKELLDPQGKTVGQNLKNVDIFGVNDVRIGKHIRLDFEATDETAAGELVENACKKIFANLIMESYTYKIVKA